MKKNLKNEKGACASFEELSAYCDNELDRESATFKHIESCEICRKKATRMGELSALIKSSLLNQPEMETINEKCAEALGIHRRFESLRIRSYMEIFLKMAAIFAIFAGVAFYIFDLNRRRQTENIQVVKYDEIKNLDNISSMEKEKGEQEKLSIVRRSHSNTLSFSDMKTAGTGSGENIFSEKIHFEEKNGNQAVLIAPSVKHSWIWTKSNLTAPNLADILGGNIDFIGDSEEKTFYLKTTKAELIKVVRSIHSAGYELLNSDEPQPESTRFLGRPEDKVEYYFTILIRNGK